MVFHFSHSVAFSFHLSFFCSNSRFDLLGDFTLMSKKQPKREEIEDKVARITHIHTLECFILRVLRN